MLNIQQYNPKIYIIIVTYNGEKWMDKCLSGFNNLPESWKVIVIDNNSSDNTVEIIKEKYPFVQLIKSGKNLGFGKANNVGLKIAQEENADHVLLLNQDAWINVDDISKLALLQSQNPEYYILSPLHYNGDNTALDKDFLMFISNSEKLTEDLILNKELKDIYSMQFINAAIWMLSTDCLKEIGGFNPSFFHYAEDNNYIDRVFYHKKLLGLALSCKGCHGKQNHGDPGPIFGNRLAVKYRHDILLPLSNPATKRLKRYYIEVFLSYLIRIPLYLILLQFNKALFSYKLFSMYSSSMFDMYKNAQKTKISQPNFIN